MSELRIPKIIHYCWFGGKPLPDSAQKCIASWKKFCPDYEIKEWNEQNYNVRKITYTAQAYDAKKYAFVSDYARFDILYEHGGIYFDTDVELIQSLDKIINCGAFMGLEPPGVINSGLGLASLPNATVFLEILKSYQSDEFLNTDGTYNLTTVVTRVSDIFTKHGFSAKDDIQKVAGFIIYPAEYFCPKDFFSGEISLTKNTYSIHHFDASWLDSGFGLIRKDCLNDWGVVLTKEEERIYFNLLHCKEVIKTKDELFQAVNMAEKIFVASESKNKDLNKTISSLVFVISEKGIQNKATSLKLYFTAFRKWRIFKTPRANLRYIYHCLRNLLHV